MARQKAFNREAAVEQVMHKIWSDGFQSASVKSLSEMLGITRSSFYHAFGSTEALFKEVLSVYSRYTPLQRLVHLQKGEPVLMTLTDTLRVLCKMRAQDSLHKGCLAMNSVAEFTHGTELACYMAEQLEMSNARIETLLVWATEQGELDPKTDTAGLAIAVTNLFVGLNVMSNAIHEERLLWLAAKTTLVGLGLYRDENIN